ncbi:MAG: DEAD/DEAH box helicase [Chthoniobacter sp.]|uniref:DEAD/DEAH box helicase n=1 Tax=Chthoniobacter sp. TaxID=2510640 RepID=UPI0032A6DF5D
MIPITERFLSDAGGWQALKQARSLHQMGRVIAAKYEPPLLEGRVREGEQEFRTGLKILSASKVENLCTCRESRQRGVICAHALAVGLEIIKPRTVVTPAIATSSPTISMGNAAVSGAPVAFPTGERPKFHLQVEGSLNYLTARLDAEYGTRKTTLAGSRFAHPAEEAATERLRKAGFADPDSKGDMVLKGEPRILAFFAGELPRLQRDWNVTIGARFDYVTREIERIEPKLQIRGSGENWFDLSLELGTPSGEQFSAAEIQRLLQSGQSSTRLKNKKVAVFDPGVLDELQQALTDCNPEQRQPGMYRVARAHAGYLDTLAREQGAKLRVDARWNAWTEILRDVTRLPVISLGDLEEVLRAYQKTGVYWLKFLADNGLAGIIADEMGLGKTVQALAFLRELGGRALIVCPSSLVFNWVREAARFTPERKVLVIAGEGRAKLFGPAMEEAELVITSYPLLRRDIERYRDWEFDAVILDEAQHIKNPDSQNAQAACALRAKFRFLLTGTPIENSLKDLWSLMHFLMPGYLGSAKDFRERYEREIQNDPLGGAAKRLLQRIRPFVLRRTKRVVAKELPEKIEQVSYCELTPQQKDVYAELVKTTRRTLSDLAGAKDQGKARITMLTALLRLRQACCDLRLLGQEDISQEQASAKIELLRELLAEAVDGGHRVLIFSQFVSMLTLLREALTADEIPYCYLDGSTKDRAAEVDRFQTGEVPAFLISLKAGGVGLNLTAADTVIHFDPWWNPAVEMQATDRAHRIGQQKVVTAYKLIARDTVEEKILALQQKKRALVDATIESEQPLMDGLSFDEIEEMLT